MVTVFFMRRYWPLLGFVGAIVLSGGCGSKSTVQPAEEPEIEEPKKEEGERKEQPSAAASLPVEVRVVLDDKVAEGQKRRLTKAWTGGAVGFVESDLTFTIARDYEQRLRIGVENRGKAPVRVTAEIGRLGDGLLGGVVGAGGSGRPLAVPAGGKAELDVYLFAQDATRRSYPTHLGLRDADSGQVIAVAPLTIFVPLPQFAVKATLGPIDPGTLGRQVILVNEGDALTDLRVTAGKGLEGKMTFQPGVSHAHLAPGGELRFMALPRLSAEFTKLEGNFIVGGAGQQKEVPLRIDLPPGKRVFVATSFTTTSDSAAGKYCTNNPNTNTPIGGPGSGSATPPGRGDAGDGGGLFGGPMTPWNPNNPDYKDGNVGWQWGRIGPVTFHTVFGKMPDGVVTPSVTSAGHSHGSLPPLGLSSSGDPKTGIDPSVQSSGGMSAGDPGRAGDASGVAYPPEGGQQHGPRGREVRAAYLTYRSRILEDNQPEAMLAFAGGPAGSRVIVQAWHSDRHAAGRGRQILVRVWDGFGQKALTQALALSDAEGFGQWPAALATPDLRALVVWETAQKRDGPASLVYRISAPGFGSWSKAITVPGAEANDGVGNYDPVAVLRPDGGITLVWQQGEGKAARVMVTRSNDKGVFGPAVSPRGMPAGASRPIPRVGPDGMLHLVFQAPSANGEGTEVHYAISRDGGTSVESVTRLSPAAVDAGEADLLIRGQKLHAAFRAGPSGKSRVMRVESGDGGKTWTAPAAVSPEDQYAEYPSLSPHPDGGVAVEYYGDLQKNQTVARTQRLATGAGEIRYLTGSALRRFRVIVPGGATAEPRRLLTHFPSGVAAWLQVNFQLKTDRASYRPHELSVLLNGRELLRQKDVIPEGTYLVPFDPAVLRVDEGGLPRNVIGLRTRHMQQAHYNSAADFRLQVRHAFRERHVVAADQREADALVSAETDDVNHGRADVGLFAVPAPLPAAPKEGEIVTVPLLLANLGEVSAEGIRVEVFHGVPPAPGKGEVKPLGTIDVKEPLAPLTCREVQVRFPYLGHAHYSLVVRHNGKDFDPTNDTRTVSFTVPKPPAIAARDDGMEPFAIRLTDEDSPAYFVRFLDADSGKEVAKMVRGQLSRELPAGRYRIALTRHLEEGQEVIFPRVFTIQAGRKERLHLRTAVEIALPAGFEVPWRWEVVKADKPDEVVQWTHGTRPVMLVPPGEYLVAFRPTTLDWGSQRLLWPKRLQVREDEHHVLNLDSGIELAAAESPWRWEVARADKPDEVVQWHAGDHRRMILPPGDYRIALRPTTLDRNSGHLAWPAPFRVRAGDTTVARLGSGIQLQVPAGLPVPWRWEVARADKPDEVVQWHAGEQRRMILPPGDYRVALRPTTLGSDSGHLVWPEKIEVKEGRLLGWKLETGLRLVGPKGAKPSFDYRMIDEATKKEVQWARNTLDVQWVPVGTYTVETRATLFDAWQKLVGGVKVERGRITDVTVQKWPQKKEGGGVGTRRK